MNAAVVGFGSIGPVHAQVINQCENAVLYGICDVDRQRAQKGAEEYNCKAFDSFDAIICDENVDVVHICTPHYLHYDMITKALDTGKKVVCEKPAVMTKKELDDEGIEMLPRTLGEAIHVFKKSDFIKEALGKHVFEKYVAAKAEEWNKYRTRVSQWEIDEYLGKY